MYKLRTMNTLKRISALILIFVAVKLTGQIEYVVTAENLNFRDAPSITSDIIGVLNNHETLINWKLTPCIKIDTQWSTIGLR